MGQIFELIADNALNTLDSYNNECHVCNKTDINLYEYQGKLLPENGEIDDDIYAVCTDCILTKKLTHTCDFEYIATIDKYLAAKNLAQNELKSIRTLLIKKYQETPNIPRFIQYEDRPLCCNNITEFVGHPNNEKDLYEMNENVIYWEKKIKEKSSLYDFRKLGNPESFRDVALFKCSQCDEKYFTFQFT